MGIYDNNPLIKARFKALGFEKYYELGYTGKTVKFGLIDEFNIDHGHQMASIYPEVAKDIQFHEYNMNSATVYAIRDNIYKAVDDGMNIISISRSADVDRSDLHKAVQYAKSKGVLVICSAGNTGDSFRDHIDIQRFPAYYDETLSIVGVDNNGMPSSFSSHNKKADVCTYAQNILMIDKEEKEGLDSGTSPATMMVACALALEWDRHKQENRIDPTVDYMFDFARTNTLDMGKVGYDMATGYGMFTLDMRTLLQVMLDLTDFNNNGNSDRVDEIENLMNSGKSYEEARGLVNYKYYIVRYEIIEEIEIPVYGGRKF